MVDIDEFEQEDISGLFEAEMDAALEAQLDRFESNPGVSCSRDMDDIPFGTVPF